MAISVSPSLVNNKVKNLNLPTLGPCCKGSLWSFDVKIGQGQINCYVRVPVLFSSIVEKDGKRASYLFDKDYIQVYSSAVHSDCTYNHRYNSLRRLPVSICTRY